MNKAKLRGHHLIYLNFFRGEGYSDIFIKNIYSVIEKENIEIVTGPDDVCARCPYLDGNKCSNNEYTDEKIMLQDKEALKLLRFSSGIIVDRESVSARIPQIIEKWKEQFCLDCGYRNVCF